MTIRSTQFSYRYRFTKDDCDAAGNVYYASMFRVAEDAREQFLTECVKGYRDLVEDGLRVLIADAQFKFETEFLPFSKADCVVTVMGIAETEVAFRFQFLQLETGQTYAETKHVVRFADANHVSVEVPLPVKKALTALVDFCDSRSMSFKNMAAAG